MANIISKTYRDATWANEAKDRIDCEVVINYDDGTSRFLRSSIAKDDGNNPDWIAIIEKFGAEGLDEATTDAIVKRNADRERRILENEERRKKENEFRKQEELFAIKLEAFEIEAIKNSKDRELKSMIRKSKTPMEVQAYTTIILMKELDNASQVTATPEEQPAAE